MSESFSTAPLQNIPPSYVYWQYSDDENIQAFAASYNVLAQSYLAWFNAVPLALYTSSNISGPLLDWVAQGIYGIARPVLSSLTTKMIAGLNSGPLNMVATDGNTYLSSGTAMAASDDIYKRVLTWWLYRGDGKVFSVRWLKNRVSRFLNGANGSDYPVLDAPPSISVSDGAYTITIANTQSGQFLQQCVANGILALPFQYTFTVDFSS